MIRNYVLTAWRHLVNNRLFSAINVFGLSVGLMSCILIMLFVRDELSYDRWIPDAESIVRLHTAYYSSERPPFLTIRSAGRMMEALSNYAPDQIETGVRLLQSSFTVTKDAKVFNENIVFADASFFEVFDFPFMHGSSETSYTKPLDLVISEEMAIKYFGRVDVVGETLTVCCVPEERIDVTISGVLKDLPENTHMDLDMLVLMEPSMFDFAPNLLNTWTSVNTYTYFKLKPGATAQSLKERVDYWLNNESPLRDMVPEDVTPSDMLHLKLMSLPDLHLQARRDAGNLGDFKPLGDINMVYAFSGVALLILIIASINFMNLSTARATKRAREVALRKVMGASRLQVASQFLGEAVAISIISLLLALVAVEAMLPTYNDAISRDLSLVITSEPVLLFTLVVTAIILGLVSGSYPALFLSRFLPARIMKANQSSEASGQGHIRSTLVIFQFAISIGLAACTMVMYGQTSYARSMDVGYSYDHKLVLLGMGGAAVESQQQSLINELERLPSVTSVVLSSEVPSQDNENNTAFTLLDGANHDDMNDGVVLNYYTTGYDFFEAYDMRLIAGRAFDETYGNDSVQDLSEAEGEIGTANIIINESAAYRLGFSSPEDAVGKTLRAGVFRAGTHDLNVIGVASDVHFRSIKFSIRPSVFLNNPKAFRVATVSFTGSSKETIAAVESTWQQLIPDTPITHQLLDTMISDQYRVEEQQANLFAVFTLLALIIACLGLFGLAAFAAERRTREIGIRKVMGARIRDILGLLIWQFSIPVLIANVIAWPLAWYAMTNWLEAFPYRIDSMFVIGAAFVAGTAALMIAWLTVASRAFRIATANPVHALRYE